MKNLTLIWFVMAVFTFISCEDDTEKIIDSSLPNGTFTAQKGGTFVAQNGTPTAGTVDLGLDEAGSTFLKFNEDFMTELGTGTVTVYLSTSDTFTPNPGEGNPDLKLIGAIGSNGESYHKIMDTVESKFTHVILWCGSASIPFGNAALQSK
ncbi:DM13 domain-containing protein [Flexithrix dorotheae]|uniref:DM13 domain-containing protein n=1 Tax=Flexithrix dorotheae TaxID=70993 RepID=UPI0003755DBA|nr:DM13 domain-containing protein [Flexithrix dorotheae]